MIFCSLKLRHLIFKNKVSCLILPRYFPEKSNLALVLKLSGALRDFHFSFQFSVAVYREDWEFVWKIVILRQASCSHVSLSTQTKQYRIFNHEWNEKYIFKVFSNWVCQLINLKISYFWNRYFIHLYLLKLRIRKNHILKLRVFYFLSFSF